MRPVIKKTISRIAKNDKGRWSTLGNLLSARSSLGVQLVNDQILVVGGNSEDSQIPVELCTSIQWIPENKIECEPVMKNLDYPNYPAVFLVEDDFCEFNP